jgi:phospholipid/cholesterol/gamma-HCH transport system ATP-binding protein
MNSVMGIGEQIIYINQGKKDWEGTNTQVVNAPNQSLIDFVFASDLLKQAREQIKSNI